MPDAPEPAHTDGDVFVLSRRDIEGLLGDAFVDARETMDDVEAMRAIDLCYQHLTGEFDER